MRTLKELKNGCPCPIDFHASGFGFFGQYVGLFTSFPPAILISTGLPHHEKFAALAHEVQHANCYKNSCFCFKGQTKRHAYYREYHAFKAELLGCVDYKEALRFAVKTIEEIAADKCSVGDYYVAACRNLMKTKLYAEACLRSA